MALSNKATRLNLFSFNTPQMRAFHLSWLAFFLCFFGWFGIAPLMAVVREDLQLSKEQIGNIIIASVAITVLARLAIGPLCDRYGPRRVYTALLLFSALPVMGIGLAQSYESFLLFRLAIGVIGASFVVTQFHTSVMFAPNVIGVTNATAAGWGNLGGGVTQITMPLIMAGFIWLGAEATDSWRLAMLVPGVALLLMAWLYWRWTQDTPEGNFEDLPARSTGGKGGSFMVAARDWRVWMLFLVYGACFGVELTIHNIAALYFFDRFEVTLGTAGLIAGLYGVLNLFTRSLGGWCSDRCAGRMGLHGRVRFLAGALLCAGLALMVFSQMGQLVTAALALMLLGLFAQMASGATYGLAPFVNRQALGGVAGIIGAGGNTGAMLAGFLFKSDAMSYQQGLLILGMVLACSSLLAVLVRFPAETLAREDAAFQAALAARAAAEQEGESLPA